jgi:hypothetical protein
MGLGEGTIEGIIEFEDIFEIEDIFNNYYCYKL